MKFNIQQTELNTALQHLVRNTDNKFFADIKMKLEDNDLTLQATNGEVSMEYRLKVNNADAGTKTVLVKARNFTDIISRLSGEIIFDNGAIKSGRTKLKIDLIEDEGFVFFEKILDEIKLEFSEKEFKEFKEGIKNRLFACDSENPHSVLSGVYLDGNELATCDGNRLAVFTLSGVFPLGTLILSNRLCQEILKSFDKEKVTVTCTNNKIMFESENKTIIGSLLQGTYPNYKKIMPKPQNHVLLDKTLVINALDLLKLIDDKYCTFIFSKDKLILKAKESETEIDIEYDNEDVSIVFNNNYMVECLKNISGEVIDFGFTKSRDAVTLSTDKELTLLMPIVKNN